MSHKGMAIIFNFLTLFGFYLLVLSSGLESKFFSQRLDHFSRDTTVWQQQYFVNSSRFDPGGVIYIYISGEFELFELFETGELVDFAPFTFGIRFALKHRYFGKSKPTKDCSVENLKYLTVEQATADIAHFISYIKRSYPGTENSKVILYGEKHGAAVAVWARQKYPHLIDGVWASSAYVKPVINHKELTVNIGNAYKKVGGQRCYDVISNAFETLDLLVWLGEAEKIKESFKLCSAIDTNDPNDVASLSGNIVQVLQFNHHLQSHKDIERYCNFLVANEAGNDFDTFAKWLRTIMFPTVFCFNFKAKHIVENYQKYEWDFTATFEGDRQKLYMRCNQLGQFGTSDADPSVNPFGSTFGLEYFEKFCNAVLQKNFTDHLNMENKRFQTAFGGSDLAVTNVFFSQGEFDPKFGLGLTEDLNEDAPVVVIPLQSTGKDLRFATDNDTPELQEAKRRAKRFILKWVLDLKSEKDAEPFLNRIEQFQTINEIKSNLK